MMPPTVNTNISKPCVLSYEERMDALADILAEGIVYLGERGLLDFSAPTCSDLPIPPVRTNYKRVDCSAERP